MEDLLVLDGYNVIFAYPHLTELARKYSLQDAREELIQLCEREKLVKWQRIVIVFDGRKGVRAPVRDTGGVEIRFSRTSADAVIEKLVHDERQDTSLQVTVVTNDRMIRQMVRGNGAFPITVAEFFASELGSGFSGKEIQTLHHENVAATRLGDMLPPDVVEKLNWIASRNQTEPPEDEDTQK